MYQKAYSFSNLLIRCLLKYNQLNVVLKFGVVGFVQNGEMPALVSLYDLINAMMMLNGDVEGRLYAHVSLKQAQ